MILITSAGGKTGKAMITSFARSGQSVRAFVRRNDGGEELRELGAADIFCGDLDNPKSLIEAAKGCKAIYYICPNMTEKEKVFGNNIIVASREAEVKRLIFHAVLHPQVRSLQHHGERLSVEEAIIESGLPFSILQVGSYFQNMLPGWKKMLETGVHSMAYEVDARMSLVDLEDVTEAAVKIFQDPGCENGIFELCGSVITLLEKAEILSEVLGTKIKAEKLPSENAIMHAANLGVGMYGQECMRKMFAHYDKHGLVGSPRVLQWLLGRPPTTFRSFAERAAKL